MNKLKFTSVTF